MRVLLYIIIGGIKKNMYSIYFYSILTTGPGGVQERGPATTARIIFVSPIIHVIAARSLPSTHRRGRRRRGRFSAFYFSRGALFSAARNGVRDFSRSSSPPRKSFETHILIISSSVLYPRAGTFYHRDNNMIYYNCAY